MEALCEPFGGAMAGPNQPFRDALRWAPNREEFSGRGIFLCDASLTFVAGQTVRLERL